MKALLADGFTTTICTFDNSQRQSIVIMIQEEMKKINITANIEVVEYVHTLLKQLLESMMCIF